MARLGSGLSAAQRNDFGWWKEAWDAKHVEELGDGWPETFLGRMQSVLDQIDEGTTNAFSLLVYSETRRCFSDRLALRV